LPVICVVSGRCIAVRHPLKGSRIWAPALNSFVRGEVHTNEDITYHAEEEQEAAVRFGGSYRIWALALNYVVRGELHTNEDITYHAEGRCMTQQKLSA
jgi:hypothetical protein